MKFQFLILLVAFFGIVEVAGAQLNALSGRVQQRDVVQGNGQVEQIAPATDPLVQPNVATEQSRRLPAANGRSGIDIGSPNAIKIGGGEGLRFGPPGMGVQYGGGQGVRYGTDNFGVRYGGGEGVRYGTRNIGVQYGGGQILRWGTPNAGVKIGGGEGFRIGTRTRGVQFGTGRGLQIGRIRSGN